MIICAFCGAAVHISAAHELKELHEFYICAGCLIEWLSRLDAWALSYLPSEVEKKERIIRVRMLKREINTALKDLEGERR